MNVQQLKDILDKLIEEGHGSLGVYMREEWASDPSHYRGIYGYRVAGREEENRDIPAPTSFLHLLQYTNVGLTPPP